MRSGQLRSYKNAKFVCAFHGVCFLAVRYPESSIHSSTPRGTTSRIGKGEPEFRRARLCSCLCVELEVSDYAHRASQAMSTALVHRTSSSRGRCRGPTRDHSRSTVCFRKASEYACFACWGDRRLRSHDGNPPFWEKESIRHMFRREERDENRDS